MPWAPGNRIRLYYEVTGSGAPLVLAHGYACGVRSWEPQVRAFTNLEAPAAFNAAVKRFLAR
jgi:pimeloyl-ACP methyl ester carboxylesterase